MKPILKCNRQLLKKDTLAFQYTNDIPILLGATRWYDFADTSTITLGLSGISQIDDKSGQNIHLIQPTAVSQPALHVENGCDCAHFEDHWMYMSSEQQDCQTVAIVTYEQNEEAHEQWGTLLSPTGGLGVSNGWHRSDNPDGTIVGANNYIYDDYWDPDNANSARYGTTWVNNVNVGSGTTTRWPTSLGVILTIPAGPLPIGTVGRDRTSDNRSFNGVLAEYITFNRALSTSEVDLLNRYLMAKWRIS